MRAKGIADAPAGPKGIQACPEDYDRQKRPTVPPKAFFSKERELSEMFLQMTLQHAYPTTCQSR
jgi:hypothetical protein